MASFLEDLPELALAPRTPSEKALKRIDQRMQKKNARQVRRLLQASEDAEEIDDSAVIEEAGVEIRPARPEGWSDRRYRMALDLRRPKKHQPGYVDFALRVFESYRGSAAPAAAPLAADIKVYMPNATINYPRRVLEDGEK